MKQYILFSIFLTLAHIASASTASPLGNANAGSFRSGICTIITSTNSLTYGITYNYNMVFSTAFPTSSLSGFTSIADVFTNLNTNNNIEIRIFLNSVSSTYVSVRAYGYLSYLTKLKTSVLAWVNGFNTTNLYVNMFTPAPNQNITISTPAYYFSALSLNLTGGYSYATYLYAIVGKKYGV